MTSAGRGFNKVSSKSNQSLKLVNTDCGYISLTIRFSRKWGTNGDIIQLSKVS